MKKKELIQDICILSEYIDTLKCEMESDALEIAALQNTIDNVCAENVKLNDFIKTLEKQLLQQDKAIDRKDMQFAGLKACYKDDLINGKLG